MAACADPAATLPDNVRQRYVAAYQKLRASNAIVTRTIAGLPSGTQYAQIDVSDKIQSASFGHKTILYVPLVDGHVKPGSDFYVGWGRSTNMPATWFGPCHLLTSP